MKKHRRAFVVVAGLFVLAAGLGSCALFGIDGPTYLGVDWEGGTLNYAWTFPYPFNVPGLWIEETFYEVEPATYYFAYELPLYGYSSPDFYLNIEADSGTFPFGEGAETYFALLLMNGGPQLVYGDQVAAKVSEPDGSWTATASYGGRTVTLGYKAESAASLSSSPLKASRTK